MKQVATVHINVSSALMLQLIPKQDDQLARKNGIKSNVY